MKRSRMIVLLALAEIVAGCSSTPKNVAPPPSHTDDVLLIDADNGHNHLQVYSFGGTVTVLKLNVIKGNGITIRILNQRQEVAWEEEWDEAETGGIVDYSEATKGIYRITECTTDYRTNNEDDDVDLIQTTLRIGDDGKAITSDRVVLRGEQADPQRVEKLVQKGLACLSHDGGKDTETDEDEFVRILMQLRNIGVNDPDLTLKAMATLAPKTDGAIAEDLDSFRSEVEWIKKIRAK